MRRTLCQFGIVLSAAALICACASDPTAGYSTLSTYPGGYATVAVPIFENSTFDRGIEFQLADALIKEIESRTPYRVARQSRADTVLTGRITRVEREQLSKSRFTGLGEELILAVTIDFEWKDARSGRIIQARREFTSQALFLPSQPSAEPQELARFGVVQTLAKEIVEEMRADW